MVVGEVSSLPLINSRTMAEPTETRIFVGKRFSVIVLTSLFNLNICLIVRGLYLSRPIQGALVIVGMESQH